METLSDFGSVSFFGISTLTTGIYNAWISFDDLALANRLSFYLLIFILGLFVLENLSRKKAQYHSLSRGGFKSKALIYEGKNFSPQIKLKSSPCHFSCVSPKMDIGLPTFCEGLTK